MKEREGNTKRYEMEDGNTEIILNHIKENARQEQGKLGN